MAVLRVTRFLLLALLYIVIVGSRASGAETTASSPEPTAKAYSPFDEPRPKIPQEIIADKRLDQKVKVFCKSKNMKQFFADLSAKTGVKITANRKLWGERPIIYFHNRPLRDVLTEISGLYGYRWLIGGKPGANEYEMFEDIRHAERRTKATKEMKAAQDGVLLDLAKMCMEDDSATDRLLETENENYGDMFSPVLKDTNKLFRKIGLDFLRDVLANGNVDCKVSDLPLEWQQALLDWRNGIRERSRAVYLEMGEVPPKNLMPRTLADMATSNFKITRGSGMFGMPAFGLNVMTPQPDGSSSGSMFTWPFRRLSEDAARTIAGRDVPKKILSADPLPEAPKITADKLRLLQFQRALLLGDVLEAIARQSNFDVVADYHYRDETMEAVKDVELRKAVEKVCSTFGYTCQVDKQTLQFRFNKWFTESVPVEPPSDLVERLWRVIEKNGRASISDLGEFSSLPDTQIKWPGFKYMIGCDAAAKCPDALRVWVSLSESEVSEMRSNGGLAVSQLATLQKNRLYAWCRAMNVSALDFEIDKSTLKAGTSNLDWGWPEAGTGEGLSLVLPDGTERGESIDFPPALSPGDRKVLIAQRRADAAADVIEMVKQP